jgi:hypothetical protein
MRLPAIQGVIRRRILVNFRIAPEVLQRQLPSRFRPKLQGDSAIAGICLIRLEQIRPKLFPAALGHSSENAAHRMAVLWDNERGQSQEGVFISRRDTNSLLNHLAGGRLFPGEHHRAEFQVHDSDQQIDLKMKSKDGQVTVAVQGRIDSDLPPTSKFKNLAEASGFFEPGSLGYSVTNQENRFDGLKLETKTWRVEPLKVASVYSSYFADELKFPKGSVEFDCALIMRNIEHEWLSEPDLYV